MNVFPKQQNFTDESKFYGDMFKKFYLVHGALGFASVGCYSKELHLDLGPRKEYRVCHLGNHHSFEDRLQNLISIKVKTDVLVREKLPKVFFLFQTCFFCFQQKKKSILNKEGC